MLIRNRMTMANVAPLRLGIGAQLTTEGAGGQGPGASEERGVGFSWPLASGPWPLFLSKGYRGIDPCRAPCRQPARCDHHYHQNERNAQKNRRIVRTHSDHKTGDRAAGEESHRQ